MPGRLLPSGEQSVLVEVDGLAEVLALRQRLWVDDRVPGLLDAVAGARTLLLVTESAAALHGVRDRVSRLLADGGGPEATTGSVPLDPSDTFGARAGVVEVRVHYDGPDLEAVAQLTGLSPADVVAAHTGRPWRVGFAGFAPGFAYLVEGDPRLTVPRRETPRTRVPTGAVGLAGEFSGIYPRSSPGGWQLVGRTEQVLWDLDRDPPALLRPGLLVQFVDADRVDAGRDDAGRVDAGRVDAGRDGAVGVGADGPAAGSPTSGAARTRPGHPAYAHLEVVAAGPLSLVQDRGRPGRSELGVGPSGAADRTAFALGARLLGQATDVAALEVHHGGLALRARGTVTVALTGAPASATVDGRPVGHAAPFTLPDGALLALGQPIGGIRTYVSVRGGFDVPTVLGSRSYDTLSGIGPAPLRGGELLPVGVSSGHPSVDVAPVATPTTGPVTLDVLPGPRHDWLRDPAALTESAWSVAAASDRVGVRLDGPALPRPPDLQGRELPSEGLVRGAVQVPTDGRPVIFLADHPVTGGYPVVAVLTDRAADLAAQLVPGQPVRLRVLSSRS